MLGGGLSPDAITWQQSSENATAMILRVTGMETWQCGDICKKDGCKPMLQRRKYLTPDGRCQPNSPEDASECSINVALRSRRLGGFGCGIQFVVQRLQGDPEFFGNSLFVAVVPSHCSLDRELFNLSHCHRCGVRQVGSQLSSSEVLRQMFHVDRQGVA
jgi:hypothetical protein